MDIKKFIRMFGGHRGSEVAADYYVDATNGLDTNDGLRVTPFKTVAKINGLSLSPGEIVAFKKGETWRETLTVPDSGTSGNPITFTSYSSGAKPIISAADDMLGDTGDWTDQGGNVWRQNIGATVPLQVFFDSVRGTKDATPDADGEWTYSNPNLDVYAESNPATYYDSIEVGQRGSVVIMNAKEYLIFTNLHLTKANGNFNGNINDYDAGGTSRTGLIVNDCVLSDAYNVGIRLNITTAGGSLSGIDIYDNEFYGNGCAEKLAGYGVYLDGNGGNSFLSPLIHDNITHDNYEAGIRIIDSDSGQIYNNYSYDDGLGNDSAGIGVGAYNSDLEIYNNRVEDPGAEGVWVGGTNNTNIAIYYNVFSGGGYFGIQLDGGVASATIYNNTIVDFDGGIALGVVSQVTDIVIKNNVFNSLKNSSSEDFHSLNSSTFTSDNNVWDENGTQGFYINGSRNTWAEWLVLGHDANGLYEDPVFTSSTDFTLQATSPCINAGTDVGLTNDYAGNAITGVPDIGAYERQ